jgi:nitronate monooxygenase
VSVLGELRVPIVLAPLAGGPATVELAVAVSQAGGLGFLAAGYRRAVDVRDQIDAFREASDRPFGVNVFVPARAPTDPQTYAAYVERLRPEAERAGVALGEPRFEDDEFDAKIELLLEARPPVASFVFGCPAPEAIAALRDAGVEVLVTATTPEEAVEAERAGASAIVVQGCEAGGHRGSASNEDRPGYGLIALLQLVGERVSLPLVAAGGIASGGALAAALAAGAVAAQIGTAFLLAPEAGTSAAHRAAVAAPGETRMTRAFTGKPARGIVNRFMRDHDAFAPAAYPELHHVTAPLRAAARHAGEPDQINLWAGQAHELARAEPAAQIVARLAAEARNPAG